MKPDLDAIRARASGTAASPHRQGRRDVPRNEDALTLLAYIDELERDLLNERATFESCNRARQHCERECATLKARTTHTTGETEVAHRIATLEHTLAEERENVDTLRARVAELEGETSMLREQISVRIEDVSMFKRLYEEQIQDDNAARAELEAEVATLRHRDALLKRVHGALADMCCRVPTSIDEPVDHIVRLSLARANQRFVDEYDLRVSAQDWANDLRAELFDWQHAVEYVLGDNWCSADGHDAKEARRALAEWAAKAQGEAPQLLAENAQLKAQYEVMRLDRDGLEKAYMAALRDNSLGRGELLDERDAALREVAGAKRALADYDRACAQVSSLTVENAELKARIAVLEAMKP